MKDNISKGRIAEQKAARFLKSKKFRIIETNWRISLGEIDLIAEDNEYICFIEVKYRSSDQFGLPSEAVGIKKQNKIRQLAESYLKKHRINDKDIRFDVIEVYDTNVKLIKNAF